MTPKDILISHVSKVRGIRIPDVHRAVDAALKEIADYDYVIVERRDLQQAPEVLRALYCNQPTHKTDQ